MLTAYSRLGGKARCAFYYLISDWSVRLAFGVAIGDVALLTREQLRAWRQKPYIGAAFVQLQPTLLDRVFDAGAEPRRCIPTSRRTAR
jgi:hypothetical protein